MPAELRRIRATLARSRFLPAAVIVAIVTAAAALFAGSYTFATADPQPVDLPIAVVTSGSDPTGRVDALVAQIDLDLDNSLLVSRFRDRPAAEAAVRDQQVFAVLHLTGNDLALGVSSASGAAVATLLQDTVPEAAEKAGLTVSITDLVPLQPGDPHGLVLFYMTLAAVVVGFVGAVQLGVNAQQLRPWERIAATAAYALTGGAAIATVIEVVLGALELPFLQSWLISALTMFTCGMVFTMFQALVGRWALLPTWGLMVLLGNPSSGGSVAWPLLPHPFADIGGWLPPGASINAQHTAVYFPGHHHAWPFLVLVGWSALGVSVHLWRHRPTPSSATEPVAASLTTTGG